jgi:hypothetical protein
MHTSMLHGAHPELAAPSCAGTNSADGSSVYAIPRRWIQSSRLCPEYPGCRVRDMEGQGGELVRLEGLLLRRVSLTQTTLASFHN